MRIAIYARVSTDGKGQDTQNQMLLLRTFCEVAKDPIAHEYIDHASAKNGDREQFKLMLEDATRRKFDAVLVWALDRFTREGIEQTFSYIRHLKDNGVDFISYSEPHFRTTGPAGELMLALAAWMAKQERKRISDRTKAGLARVAAAGKKLGRAKVEINHALLRSLREDGLSARQIAEEMGLKKSRVHEELQELGLAGPPRDRSSGSAEPVEVEQVETPDPEHLPKPAVESASPAVEAQTPAILQEVAPADPPAPPLATVVSLDSWR